MSGGESRRNENVQFNLIDNNALKELNIRLGTTATIIEEFQADRSYFGAEFGSPPAGPLHLTEALTSGLHGRLWEAHQNSLFSARSFFQVGDVKPARENDYGVSFGGPLWRGGSLVFEGSQKKVRGNVNGNVLVPKPDERTPLTNDPETRAIVSRFLAAYPDELPNRTDINERALNTNSQQRLDDDNLGGRFDQRMSDRDQLYLQYNFVSQKVDAFQLVAGQNPDTSTKSHQTRLTWNRQWTPATTTDFSLGFDRLRSLLVPEENAVGPLVSISLALEGLGPGGTVPIDRSQNHYRYAGQLRQFRGRHSWYAGFEILRRQINGIESDVHRGFFAFGADFGRDAITNLRLGAASGHLVSIGNVDRQFRNWDLQFFLGDQWKVGNGFTLNYGLRYQPIPRPTEVNDRNTFSHSCDCNNLAPYFGFAHRLPQDWGVIRGNYSVQYGQIFPVTFQQVRFSPPGNHKIFVPTPALADPLAELNLADASPVVYLLDENLVVPYSHQYNFSWEREIGGGWTLQLGYVGSRSHKLLLMSYTNRAEPVPGIAQTSATVNIRRARPEYATIRRVLNGSIGYYDAARVSLSVPRWRGISLEGSYWFSKAIDLASSYTNTAYDEDSRTARSQYQFEQFRDMKGLSDFDQPHAFLLSAAYATPTLAVQRGRLGKVLGSWDLSAVVLVKKGTPFNIITGSDGPGFGNVDGILSDRPNLLDPAILGRTIGDPDTSRQLLPASAFGFIEPLDPAGNLGRNVFRKGRIGNVNASISRTWTMRSEMRLTFRAESINLFNTPQFAEPGRSVANPDFGQITNTLNDGRTFQFRLQLAF